MEDSDNQEYDLFVSYSHSDSGVVRIVAENLKQKGLRIFLDEWELKLGDMLVSSIESAVNYSKAGVIFFSNSSIKSRWVKTEYNRLISRSINDSSFKVISIRLEDCNIPEFASDRVWYDLFEHSNDSIQHAGKEIFRSLELKARPEVGKFWSNVSELGDRLIGVSKSLNLHKKDHQKYFEIAALLQRPWVSIRPAAECECGGTVLCGHVDLGLVDYYDNWFHICARCFKHEHVEKYVGNSQESESDMICPFCRHKWTML